MKLLKRKYLIEFMLMCLFSLQLIGQVKWAQTGFNFLSVSSDARSAGMGDAVNSLSKFSGALSHNPATMADITKFFTATFSVNSWIADIHYTSASVILVPFSGDYGVLGVSLQSVDYGEVQGTMVWNNVSGYIDTEIFKPSALSLGLGYAKMISDKFGVGANVRFAYQSLGKSVVPKGDGFVSKKNIAEGVAFDFGTIFKTGIKSLAFGMSVRNFSKEVKFEEEGFQLPLLFTLGISANLMDFISSSESNQSLMLCIDATHPRAHPEQLKFGVEYQFMKMLSLRIGYITNNSQDNISYGLGVSSESLGISAVNIELDYSYTPFSVFNNVQRFTARIVM